jgi:16S rRNA (guanine527-N7)-methyltransferase
MREKIFEILTHPALQLGHFSPDTNSTSLASACDLMLAFLAEWEKWSRKMDLTSENDARLVLEKHIFDSLQYARVLRKEGSTMDIGSGAGFPGIPLKIVYPGMDMVLVESRRKRANYLKSVVHVLSLKNIKVINARAEELDEEYQKRFDQVIFKAVAPLQECLELGLPFLREGGRLVVKKEPEADMTEGNWAKHYALKEKMPIQSLAGISSELLVFEKCST